MSVHDNDPLPWHGPQWQGIASGLEQDRLAHALLLVGPLGVGKRHFAARLARALLCEQPLKNYLPCGQCHSCVMARAGTHPDLIRPERDADSKVIKVEALREFNRRIFLTPNTGRGPVGIIDPVEDLHYASVNALLKTLEEPPLGARILLVGERWMGLPATLRSRSLILRFAIPTAEAAMAWLGQQTEEAHECQALHDRFKPDLSARKGWAEAIAAVCLGKDDPIGLAERWSKSEADNLPGLLDWLHSCSADLLKLKTMGAADRLANPQLKKPLEVLSDQLSVRVLNELIRLGLETRYLLQRSQARPQMLLENLLVSWYQGARTKT